MPSPVTCGPFETPGFGHVETGNKSSNDNIFTTNIVFKLNYLCISEQFFEIIGLLLFFVKLQFLYSQCCCNS